MARMFAKCELDTSLFVSHSRNFLAKSKRPSPGDYIAVIPRLPAIPHVRPYRVHVFITEMKVISVISESARGRAIVYRFTDLINLARLNRARSSSTKETLARRFGLMHKGAKRVHPSFRVSVWAPRSAVRCKIIHRKLEETDTPDAEGGNERGSGFDRQSGQSAGSSQRINYVPQMPRMRPSRRCLPRPYKCTWLDFITTRAYRYNRSRNRGGLARLHPRLARVSVLAILSSCIYRPASLTERKVASARCWTSCHARSQRYALLLFASVHRETSDDDGSS